MKIRPKALFIYVPGGSAIFVKNPRFLEEKEKPYDLDLGRFKGHKKVFPWMFLIKVILGLGLVTFIYFTTKEMVSRSEQTPVPQNEEIEVDISTD
jgi:hypothetical protein